MPAAHLTCLNIHGPHLAELSGLAAPLARLTGLQELRLDIADSGKSINPEMMTAIGKLSRLTYGYGYACEAIDDTVMCALAVKLTGLSELMVFDGADPDEITTGPLPVVDQPAVAEPHL